MWLIVCVAFATAAFITLVAGILFFLRSTVRRLQRVEGKADELHEQTIQLVGELKGLVRATEQTLASTRRQLVHTERLSQSAGKLGEAIGETAAVVNRMNKAIRQNALVHVERSSVKHKQKLGEVLDIAELGWTAWQWWQSKRTQPAKCKSASELTGQDEGHDNKERSDNDG